MIAGLTGGIGSGKSTVAQLFVLKGWAHFNSDEVAKDVYFEPEVKKQVLLLLGPKAYLSEKQIHRTFISESIFSNAELLAQLNAIVHPAVGKRFFAFVKENEGRPILKESALLFEAGLEKQVDRIVLVTAPDQLRIQRVVRRDRIGEKDVLARIDSQWSQEKKAALAHYVIKNDEEHSLIEQTLMVHKELLRWR